MPLLVEGETNMHTDFWESSWQRIDEKRLMEYAERKEQADPILETLKSRKAQTVCDAGCGCGAYVRRLAQQGFTVKGFDVSGRAVEIAEDLLEKSGLTAELRAASVLKTGYPDNEFDAVVCRDVLDHIPKEEAKQAVRELCRITKPGGIILLTLDGLDEEYQKEPHTVTEVTCDNATRSWHAEMTEIDASRVLVYETLYMWNPLDAKMYPLLADGDP